MNPEVQDSIIRAEASSKTGGVYRLQTARDLGDERVWVNSGDLFTATNATVDLVATGTEDLQFFRMVEWLPTEAVVSPRNHERNIAVTREFILRLSRPLSAGVEVDDSVIWASISGDPISARIHLSGDRQSVRLFFLEPLPASSRIRVTVNGDALIDEDGLAVDADGDGVRGGRHQFDFETLNLTLVHGTKVSGRVFASELTRSNSGLMTVNTPLDGVLITVDGAEDRLFAYTDTFGNFTLDPAPAGRFFVHIDGRSARNNVSDGAYYPSVGKAWQAIPEQETIVGDAFLPLIRPGTLKPVSPSEEVVITLSPEVLVDYPEFMGTELRVPANSLFADDGTRGGQVGIAPVPPDRLPGQLPDSLPFPFVITVQSDGPANFDEPAPICMPNLPNPNMGGERMPPGLKSALWSFNHDSGRWEIVGPTTVSANGEVVCTDPGVGILAPGWHADCPGVGARGGAVGRGGGGSASGGGGGPPGNASFDGCYFVALEIVRCDGIWIPPIDPIPNRFQTESIGGLANDLILRPQCLYSLHVLNADTLEVAMTQFLTRDSGSIVTIPDLLLETDDSADSDGDGLRNYAEFIVGSDDRLTDTDSDGRPDLAEVQICGEPLGLVQVLQNRQGVISAVDSEGTAINLHAEENLVVMAQQEAGLGVYNVFNGLEPTLIGEFGTSGRVNDVARNGDLVALADGLNGLVVVNISDPQAIQQLFRVPIAGSDVVSVHWQEDMIYLLERDGLLRGLQALTGTELGRVDLGEGVIHMSAGNNLLAVLGEGSVHSVGITSLVPERLTSRRHSRILSPGDRSRIFNAFPHLYFTHSLGYDVLDAQNPEALSVIGSFPGTNPRGTHRGISFDGVNHVLTPFVSTGGIGQLGSYDGRDPSRTTNLVTSYLTSADPYDIEIQNALAYLADGSEGLKVINYAAAVLGNTGPTLRLESSLGVWPGNEVWSTDASFIQVVADAADDGQVRDLQFRIDEELAHRDGSFPFEFRLNHPQPGTDTQFILRVEATDTAGNMTRSDDITIEFLADTRPPILVRAFPSNTAVVAGVPNLALIFNEPLDRSQTLDLTLHGAGTDGIFGTVDDQLVEGMTSIAGRSIAFVPTMGLPDGKYQLQLARGVLDLAGNSGEAGLMSAFDLSSSSSLSGGPIYWTGAVSDDWFEPGNWDLGVVPRLAHDVFIQTEMNIPVIVAGLPISQTNVMVNSLLADQPIVFNYSDFTVQEDARFNKGFTSRIDRFSMLMAGLSHDSTLLIGSNTALAVNDGNLRLSFPEIEGKFLLDTALPFSGSSLSLEGGTVFSNSVVELRRQSSIHLGGDLEGNLQIVSSGGTITGEGSTRVSNEVSIEVRDFLFMSKVISHADFQLSPEGNFSLSGEFHGSLMMSTGSVASIQGGPFDPSSRLFSDVHIPTSSRFNYDGDLFADRRITIDAGGEFVLGGVNGGLIQGGGATLTLTAGTNSLSTIGMIDLDNSVINVQGIYDNTGETFVGGSRGNTWQIRNGFFGGRIATGGDRPLQLDGAIVSNVVIAGEVSIAGSRLGSGISFDGGHMEFGGGNTIVAPEPWIGPGTINFSSNSVELEADWVVGPELVLSGLGGVSGFPPGRHRLVNRGALSLDSFRVSALECFENFGMVESRGDTEFEVPFKQRGLFNSAEGDLLFQQGLMNYSSMHLGTSGLVRVQHELVNNGRIAGNGASFIVETNLSTTAIGDLNFTNSVVSFRGAIANTGSRLLLDGTGNTFFLSHVVGGELQVTEGNMTTGNLFDDLTLISTDILIGEFQDTLIRNKLCLTDSTLSIFTDTANLFIDGLVSLEGNGTIRMFNGSIATKFTTDGANDGPLAGDGVADQLLIGVGVTIVGSGQIGSTYLYCPPSLFGGQPSCVYDPFHLVNRGRIEAGGSIDNGVLDLRSINTNGGSFTNQGTATSSNGGKLELP